MGEVRVGGCEGVSFFSRSPKSKSNSGGEHSYLRYINFSTILDTSSLNIILHPQLSPSWSNANLDIISN